MASPSRHDTLPEPQGYLASTLTQLYTAASAALRAVGVRFSTVDDSIEGQEEPHHLPATAGSSNHHHAILQDIGASVDQALQDASIAAPHTHHVLSEALEEDKLARLVSAQQTLSARK